MPVTGTLTLDGRPVRDADVLLVADTTVLALSKTAADGSYQLDADASDRALVVARLRAPVVGVWVAPARGGTDFKLTGDELVDVHLDFQVPAGVVHDWLDVKLTPRRDEIPPRIVLATGIKPGLAEAMYAERLVSPTFDVRVRRGLYDLRAYRIVDAPKGAPLTNLMADRVMTDGPPAIPKFGGFEVELGAARRLSVGLRLMTREEL